MLFYALMPRIATPLTAEVVVARNRLRAFLALEGNTEMALARVSGTPQYAISKFLTGRTKSLTPQVQRFLIYANIGISPGIEQVTGDPRIQQALGNAWDGTEQGLQLLASTIDALAPVLREAWPKGASSPPN